MNAKAVGLIILVATVACGCRDAQNDVKLRKLTVELLRSLSDADKQLAGEEDSLRYMDVMGQSVGAQRAVIESAAKRLASLRTQIDKHSDVDNPTINQIRYEELDHQKLRDQLKRILDDHNKGIRRAKEQARP